MSQQAMQSYGQQEFPVVRYLAQVLGTLRWTRDPRVHFALRSPDSGDSARACLQDGSRLVRCNHCAGGRRTRYNVS